MFELIIFVGIVIGLGVISNCKCESMDNNNSSEVEYPHIDDPEFEKKVKKYFKNKPFINHFDHI